MEEEQKSGDQSEVGLQTVKASSSEADKASDKSGAKKDSCETSLRKRIITYSESDIPSKIAKRESAEETIDSVKQSVLECGSQVSDQSSQCTGNDCTGTDTAVPRKRSAELSNESEHSPSKKPKREANFSDKDEKKHIRRRLKSLLQAVRDQMEFYMGDSNLSKDRFIRKLIDGSPDGYIDLSVFGTFNKLQSLRKDGVSMNILVKALRTSEMLELNKDENQVRRKTPIKEISQEEIDSRTVYVEDLPNTANLQWIQTIFSQCGKVVYVSLPKYKSTKQMKGFAFVEFETSEEATKACSMLNNPRPAKAEEKPGKFPKGNKTLYRLQKLTPSLAVNDSNEENISDDQKVDSQTATMSGSKKKKKKKARKKQSQENDDDAAKSAASNPTDTTDAKKKKKKKKKKQSHSLESGSAEDGKPGNEEQGGPSVGSVGDKASTSKSSEKAASSRKKKSGKAASSGAKMSEEVASSGEKTSEANVSEEVKVETDSAFYGEKTVEVTADMRMEVEKEANLANAEAIEVDETENKSATVDMKLEVETDQEGKKGEYSIGETSYSDSSSKRKKRKKKKKKMKEQDGNKQEKKVGETTETAKKEDKILSRRKAKKLQRQADIRQKKLPKETPGEGLQHEGTKTDDDIAQGTAYENDSVKKEQTEETENNETLTVNKRRSDGSELTSILKSRRGQERKKVEFDPVPVTTEFVKGREIRKRKKSKREELHLRVITKKEWSALKAEYISQQKSHMAALKESLRELRQQESQAQSDGKTQGKGHMNLEDVFGTKRLKPSDDVKMAHVESLKFIPNVIVQWKCSHEMHRDKIKAMFRDTLGDSIAYIDSKEEARSGYIRFKDEASAEEFTRLSRPSTLFFTRVLPADQQQAYWDRANEDRLQKLARKKQEKGSEKIARKVFERNKATFNQKPSRTVFNDDDDNGGEEAPRENGPEKDKEESLQETMVS